MSLHHLQTPPAAKTFIRSADGSHQVHVAYSQEQFRRIWGRLNWGSSHRALNVLRYDGPELPVLACPDLDAWLDAQDAEKACQHHAYLADVEARRAAAPRRAA